MKIGIIGHGVIGKALATVASERGFVVTIYDKFQKEYSGNFDKILETELTFLCLPTPTVGMVQDKSAIVEVCRLLQGANYDGEVVIRSTVEPGTMKDLEEKFAKLRLFHNPEFLRAATTVEDLKSQSSIILGIGRNSADKVVKFWSHFDVKFSIHVFSFWESELIKYTHNCFLAVKVGFFNEIKEVTQRLCVSYDNVMRGVHAIGQVGENHTKVPGPDGKLGFGGMCFPKDTKAFLRFANGIGVGMELLQGCINGNRRRRPKEM